MVDVYCDMEGTNCGGEGGWTRVAFVNMSHPGATCPTGLTEIQQSNLTLCSRDDANLIQSTVFTTLGLNYTAVCGRVRGYQLVRPAAFLLSSRSIDEAYADGVSITHGNNPRQHVWTYAVGFEDDRSSNVDCPCNTGSTESTPSFVGDNYYCESGTDFAQVGVLYTNDPLWDGMNCNNLEGPCCTNNQLPWFNTTLSETTNDDLELRLLFSRTIDDQGSPLDLIELYIR